MREGAGCVDSGGKLEAISGLWLWIAAALGARNFLVALGFAYPKVLV